MLVASICTGFVSVQNLQGLLAGPESIENPHFPSKKLEICFTKTSTEIPTNYCPRKRSQELGGAHVQAGGQHVVPLPHASPWLRLAPGPPQGQTSPGSKLYGFEEQHGRAVHLSHHKKKKGSIQKLAAAFAGLENVRPIQHIPEGLAEHGASITSLLERCGLGAGSHFC